MSTITGSLSNQESITASNQVRTFVRVAIWSLPVWAAMLFLGTLTHQPDPQTEFADFAAYVTTSQFLFSHLVNSIAGAAIGSIGMIALTFHLLDSRAAGKAITGMVAAVAGNTLTAFGLRCGCLRTACRWTCLSQWKAGCARLLQPGLLCSPLLARPC